MSCNCDMNFGRTNPCNPCGGTPHEEDCKKRVRVEWVPNTACTIGVTLDGITDTLSLRDGIVACETQTKLTFNPDNCTIEYQNERFVSSNGMEGAIDSISVKDMIKNCVKMSDLADVHCDDPGPCSMLFYYKSEDCGADCVSDEDGYYCYTIPEAGDCEVTPDDQGRFPVLMRDDCGKPYECNIKFPTSDAYSFYVRDSWPDNYDWPFYYGNYDEIVDFHLDQNVPDIFGKFDLLVDIEYVFTTERPTAGFEASVKSIGLPFFDDELTIDNALDPSNLPRFEHGAIHLEMVNLLPWGTRSQHVNRTMLVPKGKLLKMFHMVRMRSMTSTFPNPTPTPYDGQKNMETEIAAGLTNFSRMFANRITVRPINMKFQGEAHVWDEPPASLKANTNDPFVG